MAENLTNERGFTLVELLITIAIISILASYAIPLYSTFKLKAKTSEAKINIGSIRTCEESYKAENMEYRVCNASPRALSQVNTTKVDWQNNGGFNSIGFKPTGKVYYSYQVLVNDFNTNVYTIYAVGDLDGDKQFGIFQYTNTGSGIVNLAGGKY
ncbi:MAG: type II secretion system protein [bacterium]